MDLTFTAYQDTDICQFNVDDTIIETLESDNLTLQNLSGGKYVQVRSCKPWTNYPQRVECELRNCCCDFVRSRDCGLQGTDLAV